MFPPRNPQGNPPGTGQAAPPQVAPDAGAGAPPQQSGLRQVDIGFNQDVQNVVLSRIQTLNPQEEKILDAVITPQTLPIFLKLLPELKPLLDMMSQGGGDQGPIAPGGQPAPVAQNGGAPAAEEAPDAEDVGQGGDNGDDEEEETDNPLVRNQASSGLIG